MRQRVRILHRSAAGVRPLNSLPEPAAVPPIVPMVAEAASLVVPMVSAPAALSEACRLLAASAAVQVVEGLHLTVHRVPNVMLVAVPLPVGLIVSVMHRAATWRRRRCGPVVAWPSRPKARPDPNRSDVEILVDAGADLERTRGADTVEAVVAPVMPSIAVSRSPTVRLLPAPVPRVTPSTRRS